MKELALRLPCMATGRTRAVANTQSRLLSGLIALNNLRIAETLACVTPNTSPLRSKSAVLLSCFRIFHYSFAVNLPELR